MGLSNKDVIGGYFEFELNNFQDFHKDAIALNTARNCLEYILISKKIKKIHIPYFTCDVILQPIKKHNIQFVFYSITKDFEIENLNSIPIYEYVLYTNYFGVMDEYIDKLVKLKEHIIIDNAQSFYSPPIDSVDTFYSPRKFFGVPDGGYLYTNNMEMEIKIQDKSSSRLTHLFNRLEDEIEMGFIGFKNNELELNDQEIKKISILTSRLMQNIPFNKIAEIRKKNFLILKKELEKFNLIDFDLNTKSSFVYPLRIKNNKIREKLLEKKIFIAQYWPNVLNWTRQNQIEHMFTNEILALPIDQRYSENEMDKIVSEIKKHV